MSDGRVLSKRRIIIDEMDMAYENRIDTVPRELKALKAVYEPGQIHNVLAGNSSGDIEIFSDMEVLDTPMLMSESKDVITVDTIMARIGIWYPGGTYSSQCEKGRPDLMYRQHLKKHQIS